MTEYSYAQWIGRVRVILKRHPKRKEYLAFLKRQETINPHPKVAHEKGISPEFYAECLIHSCEGEKS